MKKLALVIALAVAASWALSDRSERDRPATPDLIRDAQQTIRHDLSRIKRDLARGSRHRPRPAAPTPPVPPSVPNDFVFVDDQVPARVDGRPTTPPEWFPSAGDDVAAPAGRESSGPVVLTGRLSASEERALADLADKLSRQVREWLAADVAPGWNPPTRELKALTLDVHVQPVSQVFKPVPGEPAASGNTNANGTPSVLDEVYTLYRAGGRYDFSPDRKAHLLSVYRRELVNHRLFRLGGGVALALAGLAALCVYIRTDEATKGFYTNRLRMLAAAGLGASGYAVYQVLARH